MLIEGHTEVIIFFFDFLKYMVSMVMETVKILYIIWLKRLNKKIINSRSIKQFGSRYAVTINC